MAIPVDDETRAAQKAQAKDLWHATKYHTMSEIAAVVKVSRSTISGWAERDGWESRRAGRRPKDGWEGWTIERAMVWRDKWPCGKPMYPDGMRYR